MIPDRFQRVDDQGNWSSKFMGDILDKFCLESIHLRQFLVGDLQIPFLLDQLSIHRFELLASLGLHFVDRFLLFHDENAIHIDRNQGR